MKPTPLKFPIKRDDGSELKEVKLRRFTVNDIEAMEEVSGNTKKTIFSLTCLAELSPDEVGRIDAADFYHLDKVISGFFEYEDKEKSQD